MIQLNNFTTGKAAEDVAKTNWYESERVSCRGFFKDSAGRTRKKITYFLKCIIDLKMSITDTVEITLGRKPSRLTLTLGKKLGVACTVS